MRVNALENPLGVDTPQPRFSWQMADSRRGARQTAYRIVVGSSPEIMRSHSGELWDSGKVQSDNDVEIPYAGKALASRERCWWSVQVWDKDGKEGRWSAPGHWEMALISHADGKASWIGLRDSGAGSPESLSDARWIWYPEGDPHQSAPAGTRWFRLTFDLPAKTIQSAALTGAVDNNYSASVNGQHVADAAGWQGAQVVHIENALKPGRNVVSVAATNTEPGPAGLAMLVRVTFADGTAERFGSGPTWRVSNARQARWTAADFDDSSWKPALVVAGVGDAPWGTPGTSSEGGPASLLRKEFTLAKPVRSARIYVTAKGSYRLHINGRRVGNDILTPDWTDDRKHIAYQVYDVTKLLQPGENAVGAILGDGWYASGLGWNLQRWNFGPPPTQLLMQLEVQYNDGTSETIITDGSWEAAPGPILRSEIYGGETYDARREQPGWDRAGFADSSWKTADVIESAQVPHAAQSSPPIRVETEIKPKTITNPKPGIYIFDMGQNMVGWARLRVPLSAKPGDRIRMRFAEILNPDGTIYTQNLRRAEATDTYICGGTLTPQPPLPDGGRGGVDNPQPAIRNPQSWEPQFTYHGFRYVEVTGFPGKPDVGAITGVIFHTDAPWTGTFECSSPMANRIMENLRWGQRGNLESVPTDCPQRDERLGWMGDANIFWPTACYNMDMQAFTRKWMRDVVDAQSPQGGFSDVSPRVIDLADGAPAWGDAGVSLPYTAWRQYGDTRVIADNYEAMQRWVEYIDSVNPDHLWMKRRNNDFGDWVPANSDTNKNVIATAFFAQDAKQMAEMAAAIGKDDDSRRYGELYDGIRAAFNKAFVTEDGTVGNGSQTCYVLALHMGLLDEAMQKRAIDHLVADIEKRGGHLSTGFIGSAYLMNVLSESGRDDVAYRLLLNDTFPSWGYEIKKGATTIWERWNGDTGDPAMNSFNHYAFGAVGEWMYRYLAGIGQDSGSTGFRHIVIRPRIQDGLSWVKAEYDSVNGKIASSWRREGSTLNLDVTIPPNTTGTIYLPASDNGRVQEGGKAILGGSGVKFRGIEAGVAVYDAYAGSYRFEVK